MTRQFTLPDLGEGVKEGQVLRLLVSEGERVDEDQLLMEVELTQSRGAYHRFMARAHVGSERAAEATLLVALVGS